jgi:hypothetical protein
VVTVGRNRFVAPLGDADDAIKRLRPTGAPTPSVQNEASDRVRDLTSDQEQHHPYQIVDLLPEIRHGLRSLLRSPGEQRPQEENDGYRSHDEPDQLVHGALLLRFNPLTAAELRLAPSSAREQLE